MHRQAKDIPCLLSLELRLLLFICLRVFLSLNHYYCHTTLHIIGDEDAYARPSVAERGEDTTPLKLNVACARAGKILR